MIVPCARVLFAPETFSSERLLAAAAASTCDGLNVDSGLGGSFNVTFIGTDASSGRLKFRTVGSCDFPSRELAFSPYGASRNLFALHPESPFSSDRQLPIGAVICSPLSTSSISRHVRLIAPERCSRVSIISPVDTVEFSAAMLLSDAWQHDGGKQFYKAAAAETAKSHPALRSRPVCFLAFTNDALADARLNGAPAPFTFQELAYELQYSRVAL